MFKKCIWFPLTVAVRKVFNENANCMFIKYVMFFLSFFVLYMFVSSSWLMLQHGRSDSYRVATIPSSYDDNKTADGRAKVHFSIQGDGGNKTHILYKLYSLKHDIFSSTNLFYLCVLFQILNFTYYVILNI